MRIKNILTSFSDFNWDDVYMQEQEFEDYKSKYLDLHDKAKSGSDPEKVSILDDVDFELELIHRDEINVSYIIQLLVKLKANQKKDAEQVRKEIDNLLNTEKQLRSKKELIERFIKENLQGIENTDDIPQEFERFWNLEQDKAFLKLVKDENLSKERTQALIEHYLYAEKEPMRDEILDLLEGDKPTLLHRKTIGDRVLKKIIGFVETFVNGVTGS
jgi:type I restriction enzyme R subunit